MIKRDGILHSSKRIFVLVLMFFTFLSADSVKQLTLACNSYDDIKNTKNIEETMRDGAIPRNCLLLTSHANVTVIDKDLEDKRFVKILVIDLKSYMYTLKEDVIITNENKI